MIDAVVPENDVSRAGSQVVLARCGRSGLRLPKLALGMWHNFGEQRDLKTAKELVFAAFDAGITYFDLANNYGPPPGAAETLFGEIVGHLPRDEIVVSTKAGFKMWNGPYGDGGSRKHLLASLDASLRRLQLDHVDIFYHHRPDPETPIAESMMALADAVASGKACYPAISNYDHETAAAACAIMPTHRALIANQVRYNLLDRSAENDTLPDTAGTGLGAIVYSPLAQGLLSDRYLGGIAPDSRAGRVTWDDGDLKAAKISEKMQRLASGLTELAARRGQSAAQMALAWTVRTTGGHVAPVSVVFGASTMAQLKSNLAALDNTAFAAEELAAIDALCGAAT